MLKKLPLILRLVLFVSIFLLLNHLVTRAYVRYTRQPYEYEGNRRGFEAVKDEISFLVLGDSHAQRAVSTPRIPGSYNFSTNGESYIHTYYKMRYYLKDEELDPDVVVMPISFHSFAGFRARRISEQDPGWWSQYVDYIELGTEANQLRFFLNVRLKAEFAYLGGLDEFNNILSDTQSWESERLEQGFLPRTGTYIGLSEDVIGEFASHRAAVQFKNVDYINPILVEYFNRLLDLLEEEDAQMVFVCFPTMPEYQQAAAYYFPVEDHMTEMAALLEGRENVLILDYHDLFADQYELFLNIDHLNSEGAKEFTDILLADLEENGITWEAELQP